MPTTVLLQTGTAIILANSTDHSPAAANNLGTRTDQVDLTSLAASKAGYRQATKIDFGANWARQWVARGAYEWSVAPTAGGAVNIYFSYSHSATAGTGNDGDCSGADGAYTGYGAAAADATEAVKQLDGPYPFICTADAEVQQGQHGVFTPLERYANVVFENATDQALISDAVEMSLRLAPLEDEIQD